jgi:pimeloyl-ACP methyl ester carboxylesterase
MSAMALPLALTKLSYLIDNPWAVSQARADMAGLILADSLIDRNLGARPITLVGFSLGARVIFACLKELANRGAVGLVQNAYMFGTPIVAKKDEYTKVRAIIPGRFVNGYANNDWILGMKAYLRYHTTFFDFRCRIPFQSNQRWHNAGCRSCQG